MKVVYHEDFTQAYCSDPAAAPGRIEAIVEALRNRVTFVGAVPASADDIAAVHSECHIDTVKRAGVYPIAALAAGGAIQAAEMGLAEPCFALIRPPGHHASAGSAWGFCYFNNMAIALEKLKRENRIQSAMILDFDLHYGDGTVNILERSGYVAIYNPSGSDGGTYLKGVREFLFSQKTDIIGVSAGFDNHVDDWGGLLSTGEYRTIGSLVREAGQMHGAGYFAVLEGGYNHRVLGRNVMAFIEGMEGTQQP
jgi:acetoin utilization deacetylase AcuC-like enzyme